MAVWMLFFWGSWRFHVILIIHILLAAKACLALAPACSTWSTDPPRSCLDTSINGTNSSCDTSGSNRANSHNASSINASFSGAWSKDAICGFQELGNDWGFVGDTNSSSDGEGMINKSATKIWEDDGRWSGITMGNVYHPTSSFSWRFSWAVRGAFRMTSWACSRSRRQPRAQGFRTTQMHSVALMGKWAWAVVNHGPLLWFCIQCNFECCICSFLSESAGISPAITWHPLASPIVAIWHYAKGLIQGQHRTYLWNFAAIASA